MSNNSFGVPADLSVTRVGDHQYQSKFLAKDNVAWQLDVSTSNVVGGISAERMLSRVALEILQTQDFEDYGEFRISLNDQVYTVSSMDEPGFIESLAANVVNFTRIDKPVHTRKILIEPHVTSVQAHIESEMLMPEGLVEGLYVVTKPLPEVELQVGQLDLDDPQIQFSVEPFRDDFTRLSTDAFQHLETHFTPQDQGLPKEVRTDHVFVFDTESMRLELVHQDALPRILQNNPEALKDAVRYFERFAVREHGSSKVNYIQHLFNFNLKHLVELGHPLTPEHVYRMNIGAGICDVQSLNETLELLRRWVETRPQSALDPLQEGLLAAANLELPGVHVPLSLTRKLLAFLAARKGIKEQSLCVHHLQGWLNRMSEMELEQMSVQDVDDLIGLASYTRQERERQYTGRKFPGVMKSGYKIAEEAYYKPWVDQQQLIQAQCEYEDLLERTDISEEQKRLYFYEHISHRAVKYHLEKEHPQEGYRVGQILLAPPAPDGTPQYYFNSDFLSNGYGIVNYTLQPLGADSPLPVVLANRSTASYAAARDGAASLRSDFNPFNSPGYMGKKLREKQDQQLYKPFTLPYWSAYAYQAEQKLNEIEENEAYSKDDLADVYLDLTQASQELVDVINPKIGRLEAINQLLRDHDYLLTDLLHQTFWSEPGGNASTFSTLKSMFFPSGEAQEIQNDFLDLAELLGGAGIQDIETARSFLPLMMFLQLNQVPSLSPKLRQDFASLLAEFQSLCEGNSEMVRVTNPSVVLEKSDLLALAKLNSDSLENLSFSNAKKWSELLKSIALRLAEHPTQKSQRELVFSGHSLGAGISQVALCDATSNKGRIPVAGKKMATIFFDPPAINEIDAESFIERNIQHRKLLQRQGTSYEIVNGMAEGDFVVFGGQRFLGSVKDYEELSKCDGWLVVDVRVRNPTKIARASVQELRITHAFQFLSGVPGLDFLERMVDPIELYEFKHPQSTRNFQRNLQIWQLVPNLPAFLRDGPYSLSEQLLNPKARAYLQSVRFSKLSNQGMDFPGNTWRVFVDEDGLFHVTVASGVSSLHHDDEKFTNNNNL